MTNNLLIRADDAGLSMGTNLAIRDAVQAGTVRNVGLMATGPALAHAAQVLLPLADRCCFGVHATTTSEFEHPRLRRALGKAGAQLLVRADDSFHPQVNDWFEKVTIREIEDEIRAQIETLRRAGFSPCYIDTHMGFHWVPGVERMLVELAISESLVWGDDSGRFPKMPTNALPDAVASLAIGHPQRLALFHPARTDSQCAELRLVGSHKDLLPQRCDETARLIDSTFAVRLKKNWKLRQFSEYQPRASQP